MREQFRLLHLDLIAWPRMAKRLLMFFVDAAMLPLLMLAAFMIRLDSGFSLPVDIWLLPAAAVVTIAMLQLSGFYRMVIRFMGSEMAYSIVVSMVLSSAVFCCVGGVGLYGAGGGHAPFRVYHLRLAWHVVSGRQPLCGTPLSAVGFGPALRAQTGGDLWRRRRRDSGGGGAD